MKHVSQTFIDIRRLRVLRELHERRTVAATASAVHLTPSAVSQQLAALAREVGVPLTERHGRGVRLTRQALVLLEHAAVILAQMERARADLETSGDGGARPVIIGAFATAIASLVTPAIRTLGRRDSHLQLMVREVEPPESLMRLDAGDLDLVVTIDYRGGPHRNNPRYARRDLLLDPYDVVLPKTHRLAGRRAIKLADLVEEPWIMGEASVPCSEVTRAACTSAGFSPDVRHTVNEWGAVFTLVAAGEGIALVPRLATGWDGVAVRPIAGSAPTRNIYVAMRAGSEHSPLLADALVALEKAGRAASRLRPHREVRGHA